MGKKIMVVDDEPVTIELLEEILTMYDYEAILFTNSKNALNYLIEGNTPDLLLLDIRMPEMSGIDFCTFLKNHDIKMKIVFFTASTERDINQIKRCNVLGYIFKPFDIEDFIKQIETYLAM